MRRVSEIIGKPIVSAETGDQLGSVSDALIDVARVRIVGLVISGDLLESDHVIPFSDVETLGPDSVRASVAGDMATNPREWDLPDVQTARSTTLNGMPVVTLAGHRIGHLRDLMLDERTGAFEALELTAPAFRRQRTRRSILRSPARVRIGCDAVIVPDGAVEQVDAREDGASTRTPAGDAGEKRSPTELA